ncbi:MAG TPA: N-ethylmaleimide reductase [Arenimonas sp.]|nr:N-ethylmaleimide reductase [Arenimonas sp.]
MSISLFQPITVGNLVLSNRILMAPLTRMRASQPGDVPNALMAEYYTQRAGAGLVITEATQISPEGKGYADTPGIYSAEQVDGWRKVNESVHQAGGRICMQLWHVGRVSHSSLQIDNQPPVSASDRPYQNKTTVKDEQGNMVRVACSTPRALRTDEIPRLIEEYRIATRNSRAAGFDMVEIHAAHGYLLHQFMSEESNFRTDQYGGSLENRARLCLEVVDAVIGEWDGAHVGIRISPLGIFNGLNDLAGQDMGLYLAAEFAKRGLGYLHLSEPDWAGGPALPLEFREKLRAAFPGVIIAAGNYTLEKAQPLLEAGLIDAVAFGRPFIANPDLPERLEGGHPLNEGRMELYYGGGAEGYTDYPRHQA